MTQNSTRKSLSFQGANDLMVGSKTNTEKDKPEPRQVPTSIAELITGQALMAYVPG